MQAIMMETRTWTTLIAIIGLCFSSAQSQCSLQTNKDFGPDSPLLITNGAFVYPPRRNAMTLSFAQNQVQRGYCPGSSVVVQGNDTHGNKITLTCVTGDKFKAPTKPSSFSGIRCSSTPLVALLSRTACNNGNMANIGFQVDRYVSLIDFCFNSNVGTATWAHAVITGAISGRQTGGTQPKWRESPFFKHVPIASAYTRRNQRSKLSAIFEQTQYIVDKYIPDTGNHVLAPGHLIAPADMYYTVQQFATFYFINALPMWQTIINGNWAVVEDTVRALAINNGDIDVWVGGLYRLKLTYFPGDDREIYLTNNTQRNTQLHSPAMFVPRLLFKVAFHQASNRAIVYITVNDPYVYPPPTSTRSLPKDYQACREYADCRKNEARFNNIDRGFTYCCLWSDFIQNGEAAALGLPNIGNPAALV